MYIIVIGVSMLFIALAVSCAFHVGFFSVFFYTALSTAIVIGIDAIVATAARLLPKTAVSDERKIFTTSAKEKAFYERLKIRKWKDKIPELGHFTGFRKNTVAEPKSEKYLNRYLLEARYGEIGHFFSCPIGFATLGFARLAPFWWAVALPVSLVNAVLNVLPLFVLRYNTYKLEILREHIRKRSGNR
ncbi:MAG: hypothetical protein IJX88_04645 [Clostridia bacterium]|nr:hypothetical protein [Clostridia bacterium]